MHGVVFVELQKFVVTQHGHQGWKAVAEKSRLVHKVYPAVAQYPDSEIVSLVAAESAITGQEPFQIMEAFGEFIVPALLKMYGHLLKPDWKCLDVIEHTEGTMHMVIRASDKGALPPKLRTPNSAGHRCRHLRFAAQDVRTGYGNRPGPRTPLQRNSRH
jgi:hypothetical protein